MIGTAIKKYAETHGMTCDGGMAYGKVHGQYIALADGAGTKVLQIYLHPPVDVSQERAVLAAQTSQTLLNCSAKDYRLAKQNPVTVQGGRAVVVFHDNPGTMACVERYIDEMLPKLEPSQERCAFCGQPMDGDGKFVMLDDFVMPVHAGCVEEMTRQMKQIEAQPKSGSVLRGSIGALLGAIIGAIPWAIVFMLGYVASLAGLLIGYLSNLLYGKFGGKNSRARVVAVVLAVIIGVFVGQVAGYTAAFIQEYESSGGYASNDLTAVQFVQTMWDQFIYTDQTVMLGNMYDRMVSNATELERAMFYPRDEFIQMNLSAQYETIVGEMRSEFAGNIGMGLLFGVLGCLGIFQQVFREVKPRGVRTLK